MGASRRGNICAEVRAVLTLVALLIVLSVLITIHELGHFLAARSVDIAAPRFSLGFGPRVAGFKWGETEFVISAIPLGGYVKMAGMDDEGLEAIEGEDAGEPVDPTRTFDSKPLWARAWVISAGVIMNLLFAFLVFAGLSMMYGEEQPSTTRVAPARSAAGGAALAGVPAGAEIVSVGERRVSGWLDVLDAFREAPAGPLQLRFALHPPAVVRLPERGTADRDSLVSALRPVVPAVIGEVVKGKPAERAGLRPGDTIRAVNAAPVNGWNDVVGFIEGSPGRPLAIDVQRAGQGVRLAVTPEAQGGAGSSAPVGKIGAAPSLQIETNHRPVGVFRALSLGVEETWFYSSTIVQFLGKMFTGEESARNMGGLVTIGQMSGEAARMGMERFLKFMAMFSVNLAVLNLLPIPILDGGHLMFLSIEAVRGRPLSTEARIRFSHVGLIIVVGLMLWSNGNDLLRLFGI